MSRATHVHKEGYNDAGGQGYVYTGTGSSRCVVLFIFTPTDPLLTRYLHYV